MLTWTGDKHAVPHWFDPLSTKNTKDDHNAEIKIWKLFFFTKSKLIWKRNYFLGRIFDALSIRFQTVIHNSLKEIGKTVYKSDQKWPVKEICEVPSGHVAGPLLANVLVVVRTEQLHAHHREDEDHNSKDESLEGNLILWIQYNTIECNTL